jgi:tetratricopeptide (TPR) repeat protein
MPLVQNLRLLDTAKQVYGSHNMQSQPVLANVPSDNFCIVDEESKSNFEAESPMEVGSSGETNCSTLHYSRQACLQGRPDLAMVWLLEAQNSCPRRGLVNLWAGQLAWSSGDKEGAIALWEHDARAPDLIAYMAQDFLRSARLDDSERLLESIQSNASEQLPAQNMSFTYHRLGAEYRKKGDWKSAVHAFEAATRLAPEHWLFWFDLGGAYRRVELLDESQEALSRSLALIPPKRSSEVPWIYEQIGLTLTNSGDLSGAYGALSRAYCSWTGDAVSYQEELERVDRYLGQLELELGIESQQDKAQRRCQ